MTWVLLSLLLLAVGGLFLPVDAVLAAMGDGYGAGAVGTDTTRTVVGSASTAACTTANLLAAADTTVLAARAGRQTLSVQVVDPDGAARCAPGTASTNGMLLNPALAADQAGGFWRADQWGGAVACRAVTGGTTITVNVCEIY
jgi:hypothetical protein